MPVATIDHNSLRSLASTFSGRLIQPGEEGYEHARRVHNGMVDRRPALIARCASTADVVAAVRFGTEHALEIAVRSGGHSIAGQSATEGGIQIDLSQMKEIVVDPKVRSARAQPGLTWGEFNDETARHGLAVTGGVVSTTGIAGLTLGGGLGWLMGKHGLAADNLFSVEVVTADGTVLTASADENPDLFWALCGGGGNMGIATRLEYRLHPLQQVVGGLVAHPFGAAREALRFYREFVEDASDDLAVIGALVHAPDGSGTPLAAFGICHAGPEEQALDDLQPLLDWGRPVVSEVGPMPYPAVNTMLDDGFPAGALNYWKSSFVAGLTDGLIDVMVGQFASAPSPMTQIALEHFHGAVTRVPVADTAVPHREPGFNLLITSVWTDPLDTERNVEWTRDAYDTVHPFLADRRYSNYLSDDDGNAARAAFGPNYARLAEVKRRYDPENVFRRNPNVPPAPSAST